MKTGGISALKEPVHRVINLIGGGIIIIGISGNFGNRFYLVHSSYTIIFIKIESM